jgi:phage baseplate assembly protein gpV
MPHISLRKILLITGFLLLVALIATLLYSIAFKKTPTPPSAPTPTPSATLPTARPGAPRTTVDGRTVLIGADGTAVEAPTAITTTGSVFSTTANTGNVRFYQPRSGEFQQVAIDGTIKQLGEKSFLGAENVTWSPTSEQAVIEFPDGANIVYDFQSDTQYTLPKHWEDFSFNKTGESLAFKSLALDPDNNWLGTANVDGTAAKAIEPLGRNAASVDVLWSPRGDILGYQHDIFLIGLNGENYRSLTVPGVGMQAKWTPDGQRLLYSVSSAATGYRPTVWLVDASGEAIGANRHSIGVTTWADKCTFSSQTKVVCAVPTELPEGAGLSPSIADSYRDNLFAIDLATGTREQIGPDVPIETVRQLSVSTDGLWLTIETIFGGISRLRL